MYTRTSINKKTGTKEDLATLISQYRRLKKEVKETKVTVKEGAQLMRSVYFIMFITALGTSIAFFIMIIDNRVL